MMLRTSLVVVVLCLTGCGDGVASNLADDPVMEFGSGPARQGVLLIDEMPHVTFTELDGQRFVEGDMAFAPDMVLEDSPGPGVEQSALFGVNPRRLWPNARIPFEFDANVSPTMETRIRAAMALWELSTPVRFVARTKNDVDFVHIRTWNASWSHSNIGHNGGQQATVIQTGLSAGTTIGLTAHELGHTLGLLHEQTRFDRDTYVTVHWENILPGFGGEFAKYPPGVIYGAYDVHSIMHYGSRSFSANGKPTITLKDGSTFHENFNAPTELDIEGVIRMYDEAPPTVKLTSPAGRSVSNPLTITALASDDYQVEKVELLVDGAVFATKSQAPYTAKFTQGGVHTFVARVTDAAGKVTATAPVTVFVGF